MKTLPFTNSIITAAIKDHSTPFYIYDANGIRNSVKELQKAFSWVYFKEYFAVKALPNPEILKLLKEIGCGADCSSLPELMISEMAGISGEDIVFTSNNTTPEEFQLAKKMGAIITFDDVNHISFMEKHVGLPSVAALRYLPSPDCGLGNTIIGTPDEAKFGMTKEQVILGFKELKEKGVKRFGLHCMQASNCQDAKDFVSVAEIVFLFVKEIQDTCGITLEFVNFGGGIGIPYMPEDKTISLNDISKGIENSYNNHGMSCKIIMELGRFITGPYGFLVTKVRHLKSTYRNYAGVDASMADLMRPGMYDAYHHISVLGKEGEVETEIYDVVGSLCENNDKFAVQRKLPLLVVGDILIIHDAGAHAHAMGFNYNGKLRPAELLLDNGNLRLIRRQETVKDHFATLVVSDN